MLQPKLLLATTISLGMAFSISFAVMLVTLGKAGTVFMASSKNNERIEIVTGVLSGGGLTALGFIFFMAALQG